jgi:hypothetical protein
MCMACRLPICGLTPSSSSRHATRRPLPCPAHCTGARAFPDDDSSHLPRCEHATLGAPARSSVTYSAATWWRCGTTKESSRGAGNHAIAERQLSPGKRGVKVVGVGGRCRSATRRARACGHPSHRAESRTCRAVAGPRRRVPTTDHAPGRGREDRAAPDGRPSRRCRSRTRRLSCREWVWLCLDARHDDARAGRAPTSVTRRRLWDRNRRAAPGR